MVAEYPAHNARSQNVVGDTNLYWRISGWLFSLIAVAGVIAQFVSNGVIIPGFLELTWSHNVLHIALAVLALGLGYGRPAMNVQKGLAVVVGAVYVALGLAGLVSDSLFGLGPLIGMHLELIEDIFHIAIGAWGMYAGATGPA